MKSYNTILAAVALSLTFSLGGCKQEVLSPDNSILNTRTQTPPTVFDEWLRTNYQETYNLQYIYKYEDNEISRARQLSPAKLENAMKMSKIVKHAWFGVYDEVAGVDFMRLYAPRQIVLVGSRSISSSGSDLLGTAEGGLKVTLYKVDHLRVNSAADLNNSYFHTMHHEFAHIIHQQKKWPVTFNEVTKGDYLPGTYFNTDMTPMSVYAKAGFVSAYARKVDSEDIAEVTASYITFTDEYWETLKNAAGEEGWAKIQKKIQIMKDYMREAWNIDMDRLRDVARRRSAEVPYLQLIEPSWQALLGKAFTPASARALEVEDELVVDNPYPSNPNFKLMSCQVYLQHYAQYGDCDHDCDHDHAAE